MTISASKTAKLFVIVLNYIPNQPQTKDLAHEEIDLADNLDKVIKFGRVEMCCD